MRAPGAEDLVVRVEGALVVTAGTGDVRIFERTIADLRGLLSGRARPAQSSSGA